jgi:ADP-ribosylglycohydrolase
VRAAIIGAALGDAVGVQAEGDDPYTVQDRNPGGLKYPYKGSYRGYAPNDWSDTTDFMVLVMRSLREYITGKTDTPAVDFAKRAVSWQQSGFPELGDTGGVGAESVVLRALAVPNFARDPAAAAVAVRGSKADNGAMVRSVALAATVAPDEWALLYCRATHSDDRCCAAAVMYATLLSTLALGAPLEPTLPVAAVARGREELLTAIRKTDYMKRLTETKKLEELGLGERDNRSFTLKTAAVALWTYRQILRTPAGKRDASLFRAVVAAVAAQGGDASANASVAGAVLGAALGPACLPPDWLAAAPHRAWLEAEIDGYARAVATTYQN